MKPSDDVAAVVRAASFVLLDPVTGNVLADLGTAITASTLGAGEGLVFHHLDPASRDSSLIWSQDPGGYEFVALLGPTDPAVSPLGDVPIIYLRGSPTNTDAHMESGRTVVNTGRATVSAQTNTFNGEGQAGLSATHPGSGHGASVSATGQIGYGNARIDAFGTHSASVLVDDTGVVTLAPSIGTKLNTRAAYLLTDTQTISLGVNVAIPSPNGLADTAPLAGPFTCNGGERICVRAMLGFRNGGTFAAGGDYFGVLRIYQNGALLGSIGGVAHWLNRAAFDTQTLPLTADYTTPAGADYSVGVAVSTSAGVPGGQNNVIEATTTTVSVQVFRTA